MAQDECQVEINFEVNNAEIDENYLNNAETLSLARRQIRDLCSDSSVVISKVIIDSYASPEGIRRHNDKLTCERAESVVDFIKSISNIDDSLIISTSKGVSWDMLKVKVMESEVTNKDEIIEIIDNVPVETWKRIKPTDKWCTLVDSRNKQLMDLAGGEPYKYMLENIYPCMRQSSLITLYYKEQHEASRVLESLGDTLTPIVAMEPVDIVIAEDTIAEVPELVKKPLFALKTNLLYDAVSVINIGIEVPIGNRVSIVGQYMHPWWSIDNGLADSKRHRIEVIGGNLECKYWLGDRTTKSVLTGWNLGINGGLGVYDYEHSRKGCQGEYYTVGFSSGYAHTIFQKANLRLEYSLGLGFLQSDYRNYVAEYYGENDWKAVLKEKGVVNWFGPTKAEVSLVWLINYTSKKRK